MVTRHDNVSLSTTVFRKKTHTDCYLDFSSNYPLAHKVAVTTLLTRADRVCTFQRDKDVEKEPVSKDLESNGYPKTVICPQWRPSPTFAPPPSPDMPKATITLPYVLNLAESIRRILAPWTSKPTSAPTGHSDNPWCSSKTALLRRRKQE